MKNTLTPALALLAASAALAASNEKPGFTAAMVHQEDKDLIQKLRAEYDVTEKTLMGLLLRNVDQEVLKASAAEYNAAEIAAKEEAKKHKVASKEELETAKKLASEATKAEKAAAKAQAAAEKAALKAAAAAVDAKEKLDVVVESRKTVDKEQAPEAAPASVKAAKTKAAK